MTTTTKLPDLTGTEKQVAWALSIRAKKFAWLDDMLTGANDTDRNRTAIQATKNVLASKTDAKFWIDNCKIESRKLIVKNGLQDELQEEFARLTAEISAATDSQSVAVQTVQKISVDNNEPNDAAAESDNTAAADVFSNDFQPALTQILHATKLAKYQQDAKNAGADDVSFTVTNGKLGIAARSKHFYAATAIPASNCHDGEFYLTNKAASMLVTATKSQKENIVFSFDVKGKIASVNLDTGLNFCFHWNSPRVAPLFQTVADKTATIVLAQNELKTLLNSTLYATADNDFDRPIFKTVNFKFADGALTLTATDSHQLVTATTDKACGDEFTCNVYSDALKFILPLLKLNGDDDVTITAAPDRIKFEFGNWLVVACTYTDCDFPDCSRILAEDTPVSAVIENSGWGTGRKHLIETIKLIAQVADENGAIELIFSQGDLTIQSAREKIGSARRSLESLTFGVEHGTAKGKFNAKYLLNMLTHAEDTNVEFSLSEKAIGIRTDNTTAVISPMKNSVELPKSKLVLENVA